MRAVQGVIVAAVSISVLALSPALAYAGDDPQPVDFTHNVVDAPAPVAGAVFGSGPAVKTGTAICTTATQVDRERQHRLRDDIGWPAQRDVDRGQPDEPAQHDRRGERLPARPQSGRPRERERRCRARTSRSTAARPGRCTRSSRTRPTRAPGTRRVAFDAAGHAYYAHARLPLRRPGQRARIPTSSSPTPVTAARPGTWSAVAAGSGNETSVGDLLDKEYVAAWGNGNAIVTYGDFRLGQKGAFVSARIYSSVTHDGGRTLVHAAGDLGQPRPGVRVRPGGRRRTAASTSPS